jgi:hypothetical protein
LLLCQQAVALGGADLCLNSQLFLHCISLRNHSNVAIFRCNEKKPPTFNFSVDDLR